ncbi:hypothetical protein BDQ17DRAFT_1332015 [Cyathus striatus]|nr:hypothetical protein BDQ17DRAFT_1332015 [Cyathus striatus]
MVVGSTAYSMSYMFNTGWPDEWFMGRNDSQNVKKGWRRSEEEKEVVVVVPGKLRVTRHRQIQIYELISLGCNIRTINQSVGILPVSKNNHVRTLIRTDDASSLSVLEISRPGTQTETARGLYPGKKKKVEVAGNVNSDATAGEVNDDLLPNVPPAQCGSSRP